MMSDETTLFLARQGDSDELHCPECGSALGTDFDQGTTVDCPGCETSILIKKPAEAEDPISQRIGVRFQLVEALGRGSYGSVWKAFDNQLDRLVAIKLPVGELDEEDQLRFVNEAKSAAAINHSRIVAVHDVGSINGQFFIVSELIEGQSLDKLLAERRLSFEEQVRLMIEVLDGLQAAHANGVVHRDLKPSNILIDVAGNPHIADFGLAKRTSVDVTLTMDGHVLGTPAYMSPEQAMGQGNQADARSDLYSVGVLFFELLTGERPFRGSLQAILQQIIHEDPPPPRSLNAQVPTDLETICLRCLEKQPDKRFHSARELKEELQRFLDGKPILSRPISSSERFKKWCVRNAQLAISLTVILLVLVAGITATSIFGYKSWVSDQKSTQLATERKGLIDELEQRNEDLGKEKAEVESQKKRADDNAGQANRRAEELRQRYYDAGISKAWDNLSNEQPKVASETIDRLQPLEGEHDLRDLFWFDMWNRLHDDLWAVDSTADHIVPIPKSRKVLLFKYARWISRFDLDTQQEVERLKIRPGHNLIVSPSGQHALTLVQPNILRIHEIDNLSQYREQVLPIRIFQTGDAFLSKIAPSIESNQIIITHYASDPGVEQVCAISLYDFETEEVVKTWSAWDFEFDIRDANLVFLAKAAEDGQALIRVVELDSMQEHSLQIPLRKSYWSRYQPRMLRWIGIKRVAFTEDNWVTAFNLDLRKKRAVKRGEIEFSDRVIRLFSPKSYHSFFVRTLSSGFVHRVHGLTMETEEKIFGSTDNFLSFAFDGEQTALLLADRNRIRAKHLPKHSLSVNGFDHVRENQKGVVTWNRIGNSTRLVWLPSRLKENGMEQNVAKQNVAKPNVADWLLTREIHQLILHPEKELALAITRSFSTFENSLELINLRTGKLKRISDSSSMVDHIHVDRVGKLFLVANKRGQSVSGVETGPLQLREFETGKLVREFQGKIRKGWILDEDRVLYLEQPDSIGTNYLRVRWLKDDRVTTLMESKRYSILATTIAREHSLIVAGTYDGQVLGFDFHTLEEKFRLKTEKNIADLRVVTPDRLLIIEQNKTLRYWNLRFNEEILNVDLPPPRGNVQRTIWSDLSGTLYRVEPVGVFFGNRRWTRKLNRIPAYSNAKLQTVKPLLEVPENEVSDKFSAILKRVSESQAKQIPLDQKLAEFRKSKKELMELFVGREKDTKLLNSLAVFLYWYADFVGSFDQQQEAGLLLAHEKPDVAFAVARGSWRELDSRAMLRNARPQIMYAGLLNNNAMYEMRRNNPAAAINLLQEAVKKQKGILAKFPDNNQSKAFLRNHYSNLLAAKVQQKQISDILPLISEVLQFSADAKTSKNSAAATVSALVIASKLEEPRRTDLLNELAGELSSLLAKYPGYKKSFLDNESYSELKEIRHAKLEEVLAKLEPAGDSKSEVEKPDLKD